jgi:hypothetical protein
MSGLSLSVRDRLRVILGIRRERSLPPRRSKPGVGARIVRDDVRMLVPAGMSEDLWRWLQDEGWREITFRPDRRSYRDIPTSRVQQLANCASSRRAEVLHEAIDEAHLRSSALSRR